MKRLHETENLAICVQSSKCCTDIQRSAGSTENNAKTKFCIAETVFLHFNFRSVSRIWCRIRKSALQNIFFCIAEFCMDLFGCTPFFGCTPPPGVEKGEAQNVTEKHTRIGEEDTCFLTLAALPTDTHDELHMSLQNTCSCFGNCHANWNYSIDFMRAVDVDNRHWNAPP